MTIQRHRQEDFASFEQAVRKVPEIVECWAVGGGIDYLMRIITRDIETYQTMIGELLEQVQACVDRYLETLNG